MPGLSKVIVLDPDARAGRQLQLGFDREGVPSTLAVVPAESGRLDLPTGEAGLVIVGGTDGRALDLLRRTRLNLEESKVDAPIVFAGRGVRRTDAEAAGADEVVLLPAYLRDVVTIARLLRGQPATKRDHVVGSLAETTGVYTLVRALSALGRSAVLTLMRGLRRGEIRFFRGEVTSAQVGLIHGQAALHQLLLWTEARFEFHHEDVVRRQQIPLTHDELFADAERFLEGVRDSSGKLSPSMVLEQDLPRIHSLGKQIPTEVHGVLRMFDGHRVLADVLEDSPYRVFETLRVAQRACDVGLLRVVEGQRRKATWRAVLAIEEWLVGSDRDAVVDRAAALTESGPVSTDRDSQPKLKGGRRKRQKQRANTPLAVATTPTPVSGSKPEIDWGALVPRIVGAEVGPLAGVVPAAHASGEIELPTREAPRERLEALMDTDKRTRIFPTDIGLEPKVVFDEEEDIGKANRERADAIERARLEGESRERKAKQLRERDEAEEQAKTDKAKAKADADTANATATKAKADADADAAKAKADADAANAKAATAKADADAARAKADADAAKAKADADAAKAKADADAAKAKADEDAAKAKAKAKADADAATARADADAAKAKADADAAKAKAKADADAATANAEASAAKAKADTDASKANAGADGDTGQWLKAAAEAQVKAEGVAQAGADGDTGQWLKAAAEAQARASVPKGAFEAKADADAQMKSEIADQLRKKREESEAAEDAKLRAEAADWAKQQAAARTRAAEDVAREAEELTKRVAEVKAKAETDLPSASDSDATTPFIREPLEIALPPVTIAESSTTTVVVQDTLTITGSAGTAVVTSRSTATIVEAVTDESSDGVVLPMGTIETAPVRPPPPPVDIPLDDRPEAKTGEISDGRSRRPSLEPALSEPSILVTDIAAAHTVVAAAHTVVAAAAIAQVTAPRTADIASPSRELAVSEVRKDAVAFSDAEEAFFRAGTEKPASARIEHTGPVETFDDLDEGYQPLGFWDRLRGKKHPQTSPPPTKPTKKR